MKETFDEFNDKIKTLTKVMVEAAREEYPNPAGQISAAHLIGAGLVVMSTALEMIPEKDRLDLILAMIPKLLKLAGAEAAMVEVKPNDPDGVWLGGVSPAGSA